MKRTVCLRGLVALVSIASAHPRPLAKAPEDHRVEADYEIPDGVVITAGPLPVRLFEANRDMNSVNRDGLFEGQASSIKEALEDTPGVLVQTTNRGAGSPMLRGFIGPQNLIVVDGVRFNLATFRTGPNQYVSLFDPRALDRIEVLKGPSAVRHGNGAMGGVIHLVTEPLWTDAPNLAVRPRGALAFGSADTSFAANAEADISYRGLGMQVGVSLQATDELRSGGSQFVPASAMQRIFWRLKAGYEASRWSLTGAYFGGAVGPAGRIDRLGGGEVRRYDNLDHFAYLAFKWRPEGPLSELRLTIGYHGLNERVERVNCLTDEEDVVRDPWACVRGTTSEVTRLRVNDDRVHALNANFRGLVRLLDDRLRLEWGAELAWDTVETSNRKDARRDSDFEFSTQPRGNFSEASAYMSVGAFVATDITLFSSADDRYQLRLRAGARLSFFDAYAADVPGLGAVAYDHLGAVASGGLQFLVVDTLNLYANFVQGFRSPNLQETTVLGDTGNYFEVPNADLEPERTNTIEVGARLWLQPVRVSASFFHAMLDGFIDRAPTTYLGASVVDGKEVVHRVNTTRGAYTGVFGDVSVAFLDHLSLGADVTWSLGDVVDADGVSAPGRRVPPVFGTVRLRYDHPRRVGYAEIYTRWAAAQSRLAPGDLKDPRICETAPLSGVLQDPCEGTPAWVTVGLRAGMRLVDGLRLDVSIANATDANYRVHGSGYDAAGVDIRLSLTVGR